MLKKMKLFIIMIITFSCFSHFLSFYVSHKHTLIDFYLPHSFSLPHFTSQLSVYPTPSHTCLSLFNVQIKLHCLNLPGSNNPVGKSQPGLPWALIGQMKCWHTFYKKPNLDRYIWFWWWWAIHQIKKKKFCRLDPDAFKGFRP